MAKETLELRAQAKRLDIPGYRQLSVEELKTAIRKAEGGGTKSAKRATTTDNGKATAKATPTKGAAKKTATKGTAKTAKTTERKSAPAKSSQKGTAKRRAAGSGTKVTATVTKPTPKAKAQAKSAPKAQANGQAGRVAIVNSDIDWKAESNVGASGGNRETIMKALRRFKGNVTKVFEHLEDQAQVMYPKTVENRKRSKADAQSLLRWHISRVKFDFVKDTGQHEGVVRANGAAKAAPKPKATRKAASKATGGSKKAATPKGGKKSTPAKKTAQKPAQRATGGKKTGASGRKRGK